MQRAIRNLAIGLAIMAAFTLLTLAATYLYNNHQYAWWTLVVLAIAYFLGELASP